LAACSRTYASRRVQRQFVRGSYAIKLARNSNIYPIIAIAGKGTPFVETLLDRSKSDAVFDYRNGPDETVKSIRAHLESGEYGEVRHGLDPGIGYSSKPVLTQFVGASGAINIVLLSNWDTEEATKTVTMVVDCHNAAGASSDGRDLGLVTCRWFTKALQEGSFEEHPYEVRSGGLEGVEQALKNLKDGKNSASKYVFRIADTPGIQSFGALSNLPLTVRLAIDKLWRKLVWCQS
jgi:NADPH2:quinone reductase